MAGLHRIPLTGLKEGSHLYEFKIDGGFFELFDESLIKDADLKAVVELIKRSAHMELNIKIKGRVSLPCDRCLDLYEQEIETDDRVLIKFGDQWEEVDDEVIMIPYGENELELDQLFYEFTHLGLPLKKVHADDDKGNSTCNPEMLEKLNKHIVRDEKKTDPRWNELKKLKGKK